MRRRLFFLLLGALAVSIVFACSSSSSSPATPACQTKAAPRDASIPTGDGGASGNLTVTILEPMDGAHLKSTDKIHVKGSALDKKEGTITDPDRMIWSIGSTVSGINPDGEGPEDDLGPYCAGTYVIEVDVVSLAGEHASQRVSVTVD